MIIYRIAHKATARGAYSHNKYCRENDIHINEGINQELSEMIEAHSLDKNSRRTPTLWDDCLVESNGAVGDSGNIYGFESLQSLKLWFCHDEIELLRRAGFHIITFDAEVYKRYERQIITPLSCFIESDIIDIIRLDKI